HGPAGHRRRPRARRDQCWAVGRRGPPPGLSSRERDRLAWAALSEGHCGGHRGGAVLKVAVLMGSASDQPKMAPALALLEEFGVEASEHVMSAHRSPAVVAEFAARARDDGFGVIICGAGMAAHLAGAVAARATLPVIGV